MVQEKKKIVEFRKVTFTYPQTTKPTLKNINITIEEGTVVGLIGPTGSGKSTLIRALVGIVPRITGGLLEGDIIVNGLNVKDHEIYEIAQHVNIVLDDPNVQLLGLTVFDDISMGPCNLGLSREEIFERVSFSLEVTGLKGFERRNPNDLSGGEQQLVAIASVLAMKPKIIALDEPFAMIDPIGKKMVASALRSLIEKYSPTIIISESGSDIELLMEIAQRVIVINDGEIIFDGNPRDLVLTDILPRLGIRRPQVTELYIKLREDFPSDAPPLTLDEAVTYFQKVVSHRISFQQDKTSKLSEPESENNKVVSSKSQPIIKVRNLHHVYYPDIQALKGVSLDIYPETIVGIIGQNGSGKTTLAKHLVGILKPSNNDAQIIVDGKDVLRTSFYDLIKSINYVFQNPDIQLFCNTVEEEISFGLKNMGIKKEEIERRISVLLKLLKLDDYRQHHPASLPKHLRKRIVFASILAMDPKIIILDEPTTGLDTHEIERLMGVVMNLRKNGKTIIIISHDMETIAKYTDYVYVMHEGRVISHGTPRQVFSEVEILEKTDIMPPQITRLFQSISLRANILTVEEAYNFLLSSLHFKY